MTEGDDPWTSFHISLLMVGKRCGRDPLDCWLGGDAGLWPLDAQALHSVLLVGDDLPVNGVRGSKRRCVIEANTASAVSAGASSRQTMPPSSPA